MTASPADCPAGPLPLVDAPTVAAAAAHQVRGPLSSVRLRLELLGDRFAVAPDPSAEREVRAILHEVERLSHVLEQVMAWGAGDHGRAETEVVDALGVVAGRIDAWSAMAAAGRVRLGLHGTPIRAAHTRGALEQALDVFLDNALQVSPPGGIVHVTVRSEPPEVRVEVRDEGPGMTDEEIEHACRPFWRGRAGRGRSGAGLGLTIASALLVSSGGRLELGRTDGGGLCATAVLPVAHETDGTVVLVKAGRA